MQFWLRLKKEKYVVRVNGADDEENHDVKSTLFNLDDAVLEIYTRASGYDCEGWVRFVFGNSGYDVINDYSTNLEKFLKPVFEIADKLENGLL